MPGHEPIVPEGDRRDPPLRPQDLVPGLAVPRDEDVADAGPSDRDELALAEGDVEQDVVVVGGHVGPPPLVLPAHPVRRDDPPPAVAHADIQSARPGGPRPSPSRGHAASRRQTRRSPTTSRPRRRSPRRGARICGPAPTRPRRPTGGSGPATGPRRTPRPRRRRSRARPCWLAVPGSPSAERYVAPAPTATKRSPVQTTEFRCSPSSPNWRSPQARPSRVLIRSPCSPTPTKTPPPKATSTRVSIALTSGASSHSRRRSRSPAAPGRPRRRTGRRRTRPAGGCSCRRSGRSRPSSRPSADRTTNGDELPTDPGSPPTARNSPRPNPTPRRYFEYLASSVRVSQAAPSRRAGEDVAPAIRPHRREPPAPEARRPVDLALLARRHVRPRRAVRPRSSAGRHARRRGTGQTGPHGASRIGVFDLSSPIDPRNRSKEHRGLHGRPRRRSRPSPKATRRRMFLPEIRDVVAPRGAVGRGE